MAVVALWPKRNSKETCLLTSRGGFFDGRLHSEPMEPSVKTFHDSDRREPPNSRGMDVLQHGFDNKREKNPYLLRSGRFQDRGPWRVDLKQHLENHFLPYFRNSEETYSLTPHGGFLDGLLHWEPMEPSVKTCRHSDRRISPISARMDVVGKGGGGAPR